MGLRLAGRDLTRGRHHGGIMQLFGVARTQGAARDRTSSCGKVRPISPSMYAATARELAVQRPKDVFELLQGAACRARLIVTARTYALKFVRCRRTGTVSARQRIVRPRRATMPSPRGVAQPASRRPSELLKLAR